MKWAAVFVITKRCQFLPRRFTVSARTDRRRERELDRSIVRGARQHNLKNISIEQKAASKNPRSTVGTITEIHDYLRLRCSSYVTRGLL